LEILGRWPRGRKQQATDGLPCVVFALVNGDDERLGAELALWHVYDAGDPILRLKVRYRDGVEVRDWQDGPDLFEALERAEAEGWHAYDREPGEAPGAYAIFHMKREGPTGR
jgi:hypothetical protein